MTFDKIQRQIDPARLVSRQHAIPFEIRQFAGQEQLKFVGNRGRGRENVPALADIYHALILEGLEHIEKAEWIAPPVFREIGQPENCAMAKIRMDIELDQKLRSLKASADAGQFSVVPAADNARQVKKISLISLAVNLMQIAIKERENPSPTYADVMKLQEPRKTRKSNRS